MDVRDKDDRTALVIAISAGQEEVARYLIDRGADVNTRDKYGSTALIEAVNAGNRKIAKYLIDKGADVNARSIDGWTALALASEYGHRILAQILIAKGAKPSSMPYMEKAPVIGICKTCRRQVDIRDAVVEHQTWDYHKAFIYHCPYCYNEERDPYDRYRGRLVGKDGKDIIKQVPGGLWSESS